MKEKRKKPEVLAPAGNFEKLRFAVVYGADAVYCAGAHFGLRARADNFSDEELGEATAWVHARGKKIFVTLNMIPHEADFDGLEPYIQFLHEIGVDGVLVADPGVFTAVRRAAPELAVSVSTQANNVNSRSVGFWHDLGASRIVLARELSGAEIKTLCEARPAGMEIETFVHGAMCISYSGRCLLSHYLTGRDANRGDCAQPCRWQYRLEESRRPGEYFPVSEDETGTFIMNSKDLCLARQVPELMRFGVDSFKIEGRMKSAFYVATVTGIYRRIVDAAAADPDFVVPPDWVAELTKVSHRHYTTAFYGGIAGPDAENFGTGSYTRNYDFAGVVLDYDAASGMATVEQRGKINEGDAIEIIQPGTGDSPLFSAQQAKGLTDAAGVPIASTPHAKMRYRLKLDQPVAPMSILRRKSTEREEALCF